MPSSLVDEFLARGRRPQSPKDPVSRDPVTGEDLYLPEGWGGPSAEEHAARQAPRQPTVAEQTRGTIFDTREPVKAWLRERELTSPTTEAEVPRIGVSRWLNRQARRVFEPPEFLQRWARKNVEALQPAADRGSKIAAFLQGAHEGAIGLMNPFDVATTATSVGPLAKLARLVKGGGLLARTARTIPDISDAAQAGAALGIGAGNITEGIRTGNAADIGQGIFEAGMGAVGAKTQLDRISTPTPEWVRQQVMELDPDVKRRLENTEGRAAHETRMEEERVAGRDFRGRNRFRDFDERTRFNEEANRLLNEEVRAANAEQEFANTAEARRAWNEYRRQQDARRYAATQQQPPPPASGRPGPEDGAALVRQFLESRAEEPAPGASPGVAEGDLIPDPALPAPPPRPQLEQGPVARFLAGEAGVEPNTGRPLPRSRQLERGSIPLGESTLPKPRRPFAGAPLEAASAPGRLTDTELRTAYIDAAATGDLASLRTLQDELDARRAIDAGPQPLDTTPSPFFDQEGRFTLDAGSVPATEPTTVAQFIGRGGTPPAPDTPAAPGGSATVARVQPTRLADAQHGDIVAVDPREVGQIGVDPATYQFKTADARGRTGALEGVTAWDPDSPPITVHQREDGRFFVADGHQRYNKYLELLQSGAPLPPLRVRVKRGPVESVVRGASLRNVQEGSADPLDIARLIRNGGALKPEELAAIPKKALAGQKLRQGLGLSKLDDQAFAQVLNGEVRPEHAAFVGERVPPGPEQSTILKGLAGAQLENAAQAEAFVRSMQNAGFQTETQVDLFGNRIEAVSLAKPKAQIVDEVGKVLRAERSAFSNALKNADRLEAAGNVLARDVNARHADEAGKLKAFFDELYDKVGTETNRALNEAAVALHNGQIARTEAARRVAAGVRADLESGNFGRPAGAGNDAGLAGGADGAPPKPVPARTSAVEPDLTPDQARKAMQDIAATTRRDAPVLDTPPLRLQSEGATALAPTRADLEAAGQSSMFGAEAQPVAKAGQSAETGGIAPKIGEETPAPRKARQALEEWVEQTWPSKGSAAKPVPPGQEKFNKEMVRSVMDRIVREHPKDPSAQLAAAERWIEQRTADLAEHAGGAPKNVPAETAAPEDGWTARADGGSERRVDAAAGPVHEVKFPEKPADAIRRQLLDDGYRYDYRDTTWRKPVSAQQGQAPAKPAAPPPPKQAGSALEPGSAPGAQITPSPVGRGKLARQARKLEAMRGATKVEEARTEIASPAQDNKDRIRLHAGKVGKAGPVPRAIEARARGEAAAIRESLKDFPGRQSPRLEGTSPRAAKVRAERIAAFTENPSEANFKAWMDEVLTDAERQGRQGLREGKETDGVYLASGLGAFQELFKKDPAAAWLMTRMAIGGVLGYNNNEDDPWLGALMGAGAGASLSKRFVLGGAKLASRVYGEVRPSAWVGAKEAARRSLPQLRVKGSQRGQEMSLPQFLRRPEGAVPEHFGRFHRAEQVVEEWLATGKMPDADTFSDLVGDTGRGDVLEPFRTLRRIDRTKPDAKDKAKGVFFREAMRQLRNDIKEAKAAGHSRRASYLRSLEKAVREDPAAMHEWVDRLTGRPGLGRKVDATMATHAYRILLGGAIDTAAKNLTQVFFNVKNMPARYIGVGAKQATTKAGKELTEKLRIHRPVEFDDLMQRGKLAQKVDEFLHSPMMSSDTLNRRESYLSARQFALDQGVPADAAHEWALAAMRQTQGEPGAVGKHPLLREFGPMRVFANYPHLWAEIIADTILLAKENPQGAARMAVYLIGGGLTGAAAGINAWNVLFPKFEISTAATQPVFDLMGHVSAATGFSEPKDHPLSEDLFGAGSRPGLLTPRWPRKVYREVKHLLGGSRDPKTGEHIERDAKGRETSRHGTLEGLLGLVGVTTTKQQEQRDLSNEIYRFSSENKARSTLRRRSVQREFAEAIDSGDAKTVNEILRELTPRQRREMRRQVGQTKWQRLRQQVPKKDRAEFDRQFGERIRRAEGR